MKRLLRYLWALPTTALGLPFALLALGTGGRLRMVRGVLEAEGKAIRWLLRRAVPLRGGASAITLGHIILGRDAGCLDRCRVHEHVHVRQAERWGPLFVPAYLLSSAIALLRGGDAYRDNAFEREAFEREAFAEAD